MPRLIHTPDWQPGKLSGPFDRDVPAVLSEPWFDAIEAIGNALVERGAAHVLVAGDVFDTEGPEDRVIVRAVSRRQRYFCTWWLLPGNQITTLPPNGGLGNRVRSKGAGNIRILAGTGSC